MTYRCPVCKCGGTHTPDSSEPLDWCPDCNAACWQKDPAPKQSEVEVYGDKDFGSAPDGRNRPVKWGEPKAVGM